MDSSSSESQQSHSDTLQTPRPWPWFKAVVTLVTWIELIIGLSVVASAVFLNRRVPIPLFAFYGVYFAIFLWLLYSTFRSTYLKTGPHTQTYWICVGCTIVTVGVVLCSVLTAPNSGEIAFVAAIVFCISLVLSPAICAIFFCIIRGNFMMPHYMKGKNMSRNPLKGVDEPDGQNGIQQDHYVQQYRTQV